LEKDDLHFKLQQALSELAKKREEFFASESLLQTKVQTLDTALEAAKDKIAHGFVDGFSAALEQFRAIYPDLDQLKFDPFKIVVDGKILEESSQCRVLFFFLLFVFDLSNCWSVIIRTLSTPLPNSLCNYYLCCL